MSPEPKPRSMAAVTITVNSNGLLPPVAVTKSGYMLEHPSISQYFLTREVTIRGVRTISRKGHRFSLQAELWNPQRPYARPLFQEEDMVRSAWRHAERGRTEMTTPQLSSSLSNNECLR